MVGLLTLGVYERILNFWEITFSVMSGQRSERQIDEVEPINIANQQLDEKIHEFVHLVKDNSDILYKLEYTGYFSRNQ